MHSCKAITNELVELALSRAPENQSLLAGIRECPACREEFTAMENALRATDLAMQSAQPPEDFWPGYRARLRKRLELNVPTSRAKPGPRRLNGRAWGLGFLTASIRIPVPVAAALLVLMLSSIFIFSRAQQWSNAKVIFPPPSVITRTVSVPVIQEKPVTRVVYRDRGPLSRQLAPAQKKSVTAPERRGESASVAQGLEGFKPVNEPRLTIIKGSYKDEK
jgi:hypothetical protein